MGPVEITVAVILVVAALTVVLLSIPVMMPSEHRQLYGAAKWRSRRRHGQLESLLDVLQTCIRTSTGELQETVCSAGVGRGAARHATSG